MNRKRLWLCTLVLALCNCSRPESPPPSPPPDGAEIAVGLGVRCASQPPDSPIIYRTADIGKLGVPVPSASDRRLLSRIVRTDHLEKRDVRFDYIDGSFVVFLHEDGMVCDSSQHLAVLDAWCDDFYHPGDDARAVIPSAECWSTPPPWGWRVLKSTPRDRSPGT